MRQAINIKPKKNNSEFFSLKIGNLVLTDPKLIAQAFNEFFVSIPHQIVQDINKIEPFNDDDNCSNEGPSFDLINLPISHDQIFSAIKSLQSKQSTDHNNISMAFLKKCIYQIYIPLSHIFNLSFSTGVVPLKMKIAKIVPIFKNGNEDCPDNYRPISLLCNFSKILEKIMANRLTTYLEANNIISDVQFGFRKGHSTVHPLVIFNNFISEAFNKKQHAMAVFCDLRKAFDTVNHGKLLTKLQKYGIKGLAFSWFKSYLTDRKQFVHINNLNSPLLEITIGVPQGSILGPILFLLYINDLPDASLLKALLFADDTTLLAAHEDLEELCRFVNSELKKITDYFRCNLLSLHPTKTKYILFTTKNNLNTENCRLYINNNNSGLPCNNLLITEIDRIAGPENQAVRFLGVYIDPHLNFNYHVKHIGKRLSTSLFFLNKAKNLLNERALKALYYSLIHTHIIYAIQIWSSCSQNNINYSFKLQKSNTYYKLQRSY